MCASTTLLMHTLPPLLIHYSHPSDFTPVSHSTQPGRCCCGWLCFACSARCTAGARSFCRPLALHAAASLTPANYQSRRFILPPSSPSPTAQVCTSELGAAAKLQEEFKKRGVKLVALSCNDLESHKQVGGEVLVGVAGARACGAQAAPRYYQ